MHRTAIALLVYLAGAATACGGGGNGGGDVGSTPRGQNLSPGEQPTSSAGAASGNVTQGMASVQVADDRETEFSAPLVVPTAYAPPPWVRAALGEGVARGGDRRPRLHRVEERRRLGDRRRVGPVLGLRLSGTGTPRDHRTRTDLIALGAVAGGLFIWYVGLFVVRGFAYPVGPDGPVYLWWTRLAGHDGLSAVHRPGIPAIALTLEGTLHLPLTAVLSALECVLGAAVGLGAAALVHHHPGASRAGARTDVDSREHRATWVVAAVLAGTFAVHLAAGYLATLAFAALFLGAATAMAMGTSRATVAAGLLLGAAGSAHPLFLLLGVPILAVAAAQAWRTDRAEVRRVAAASVAGCAVFAAEALALLAGPDQLTVITSRDGLLRTAGLTDVLRSAYLYRLVHRWTRYVQWASIPLAMYGLRETRGFVRRFLIAWGVVSLGGILIGLASGLFPVDRF
ncbi:MAG TPA: hypothetical protein VNA32_02430, partial [Actinomycetota bacterium]|nr:hypothetical protein [Actinomycetota bacterium]